MSPLPNRLGRTRDVEGEHWVFRFANGLVVHTDPFMRPDAGRVLPLGGPQDTVLNHLVCFPETVRGRRVFDPFAGSGIFGLMALRLGAAHVDFLDVNPRACEFQRANADRNRFLLDTYRIHCEAIETFEPREPFDRVLANPPFVPTPPGIGGSLTSAGGPEGNGPVEALLRKLERLLVADGEALIYVMQLVSDGVPLVVETLLDNVGERTTVFTPTQAEEIAFEDFCDAYRQCFPAHASTIERWRADLTRRRDRLGVQHYVMHVGPKRPGAAHWSVANDLAEKYGIEPYPAAANRQLALGRVLENVVPPA